VSSSVPQTNDDEPIAELPPTPAWADVLETKPPVFLRHLLSQEGDHGFVLDVAQAVGYAGGPVPLPYVWLSPPERPWWMTSVPAVRQVSAYLRFVADAVDDAADLLADVRRQAGL
jgi:hypothetical protein